MSRFDSAEIFTGAPADMSGRAEREKAVYEFLAGTGVNYCRMDHAPTVTMEECAERGKKLGIVISKNIFLCNTQKTRFYLLVMPASKRYVTRIFSREIGSARLSFAPPEAMEKMLGCSPGSASVMGLLFDRENRVSLYFDRDVLRQEWFGCHPCINTTSLKFRMTDFTEKVLPALGHEFSSVCLDE